MNIIRGRLCLLTTSDLIRRHFSAKGRLMVGDVLGHARELALRGDLLRARRVFEGLLAEPDLGVDSFSVTNQLACVEAALGETESAFRRLNRLKNEQNKITAAVCGQAADFVGTRPIGHFRQGVSPAASQNLEVLRNFTATGGNTPQLASGGSRQRVAIVSLLFNWPSTGGGTVHTKELATALLHSGYDILHLYACYLPWQIGQVTEPLPYPSEAVVFQDWEWTDFSIVSRFRSVLETFQPDWVIVTDSWNSKPLLIEAAAGYRTLVRIAAQESICPLNNVRLQINEQAGQPGQVVQCDGNQLANPDRCRRCVSQCGEQLSGALHQAERELCGFGTDQYADRFQRAYAGVEGVLVVNPEIAALIQPFVPAAHVIPSGFDLQRFPEVLAPPSLESRPVRFLFAGLVPEFMKGFHVLREAGQLLWQQRQDFEIWATGDGDGTEAPWLKMVGWQSQDDLPQLMNHCDVLVFPTIAQEALGRTAVEAMGCCRPVIASRIGGLAWVVEEDCTGLLCTPGDAIDLATKIEQVLDDPAVRERMGHAGREKFLREFTWDAILQKHYLPLLGTPVPASV